MKRKPSVRNHLLKLGKQSRLDFDKLIEYIVEKEIPIKMHEFPSTFSGAIGAAYPNGIILNFSRINEFTPLSQYHIILHEIGHYLRIRKIGVDAINEQVSKLANYSEFVIHLFNEEKFAEKFAAIKFYSLNKEIDNSPMRMNFIDTRFLVGIESYAKFLHNELVKSNMTFFDFTTKQLKCK